jgi:hypothetical protein
MSSLRLSRLPIVALCALFACDGDSKPKAAEPAPVEAKKAPEPKKEEVKEEAPKEAALALPWMREKVAETMTPGTELVYKLSGVDAKGKKVEDDYRCQVKSNDTRSIGTVCNTVNKPSKDKGATMVATRDVSAFSPFFAVERPEHTLLRRESVTVPAGTFETVVADLKDFFGADYTIWMIADKPGIYAKVHEKPRAGDDADKTDKTFELATITMGQ